MSEPLVSLVLPTHNGAQYLHEAIESCLVQTYTNWELIVVDDASTDQTPDIIAGYVRADPRVRCIRHEVNRKLPAALNTGFSQARGAYLTWTSDDNRYRPHALGEMVGFLEARQDVDVVYTDYTVVDEAGAVQRVVRVPSVEALVYGNRIGPSFLYRRSVQENVGAYAEDAFLAEDYDFWLRASMAHHFEPLHRDLYEFRIHGTSLTSQRGAEANYRACGSLKRHLPRLHWMSRQDRADAYLRVAVAEHAQGNAGEALRCVGQAARYAPDRLFTPVSLGVLVEAVLGHRAFLIVQQLYASAGDKLAEPIKCERNAPGAQG